ncbi:MAG: hypothetical protein ABI626_05360 [Sphingomicrobium sp.]
MKKFVAVVLCAATLSFALPAAAQDYPVKSGQYWDVTAVSIDDGHAGDYVQFLTTKWRKQQEWAKSKGYISGYHILANNYKRAGEPDIYLVNIYDHVPTVAESEARDAEYKKVMTTDDTRQSAESAERAKFRHIGDSMQLQEILLK